MKRGETRGGPIWTGPGISRGLILNQSSKYGVDTESEKGKTEDHRATLPQDRFFLLAAAWVDPGRNALQSAEQWC